MPPSSPSDDTPAWIKGDLPLDVPEPGPEPAPAAAFEPKSGPETASQADPAGLSRQADEWVENEAGWELEQTATAGETASTDGPSGAQTGDRLEAVSAGRRAELDSADNDADDVPGTPGDVEIDEAEAEADDDLDDELEADEVEDEDEDDLDDELEADEDESEDEDDSDDGLEVDEDEADAAKPDDESEADEDEAEDDELEDESKADEDEPEAEDDQDDESEADEDDEDLDDESEADEAEDEDDEEDADDDDDDLDDELEPDEDEDDEFEADEEEAVDGEGLETAASDEVIVVELEEAATDAEAEPASDAGLPEAALLAELAAAEAEPDSGPELTAVVIRPQAGIALSVEAPAPEAASEAEPGTALGTDGAPPAGSAAERGASFSDDQPTVSVSLIEAPPPIEPPVVEDLNLEALIESLLFVADGAVPIGRLAEALEVPTRDVEAALNALADSYRQRGLSVQRFREKVQLTTSPSAAAKVERFLGLAAATPLSRAALEALAIVAYQQPVTRPQIEAVRGVNSDSVIKNLLTKGLIEESGRAEGPGRPVLYSTTPEFMQHFGLTSLEDLPPLSLPSADGVLKPGHVLKG